MNTAPPLLFSQAQDDAFGGAEVPRRDGFLPGSITITR